MSPVSFLKANPKIAIFLPEGARQEGNDENKDSITRIDGRTSDGVEHVLDDARGEAALLVVVHQHDLVPVVRDLPEPEGLADVHQVQDVLLEAAATEPHASLQELVANTRIAP